MSTVTAATTAPDAITCDVCPDEFVPEFDDQSRCTPCIDEDAYQARVEGVQVRALIPTTTTTSRRN